MLTEPLNNLIFNQFAFLQSELKVKNEMANLLSSRLKGVELSSIVDFAMSNSAHHNVVVNMLESKVVTGNDTEVANVFCIIDQLISGMYTYALSFSPIIVRLFCLAIKKLEGNEFERSKLLSRLTSWSGILPPEVFGSIEKWLMSAPESPFRSQMCLYKLQFIHATKLKTLTAKTAIRKYISVLRIGKLLNSESARQLAENTAAEMAACEYESDVDVDVFGRTTSTEENCESFCDDEHFTQSLDTVQSCVAPFTLSLDSDTAEEARDVQHNFGFSLTASVKESDFTTCTDPFELQAPALISSAPATPIPTLTPSSAFTFHSQSSDEHLNAEETLSEAVDSEELILERIRSRRSRPRQHFSHSWLSQAEEDIFSKDIYHQLETEESLLSDVEDSPTEPMMSPWKPDYKDQQQRKRKTMDSHSCIHDYHTHQEATSPFPLSSTVDLMYEINKTEEEHEENSFCSAANLMQVESDDFAKQSNATGAVGEQLHFHIAYTPEKRCKLMPRYPFVSAPTAVGVPLINKVNM